MKGPVFQPAVVAHEDEDGDAFLEIIWEDRRLCVSINPSDVDRGYAAHGWWLSIRDAHGHEHEGVDLPSMHGAIVALARWQEDNDEHRVKAAQEEGSHG